MAVSSKSLHKDEINQHKIKLSPLLSFLGCSHLGQCQNGSMFSSPLLPTVLLVWGQHSLPCGSIERHWGKSLTSPSLKHSQLLLIICQIFITESEIFYFYKKIIVFLYNIIVFLYKLTLLHMCLHLYLHFRVSLYCFAHKGWNSWPFFLCKIAPDHSAGWWEISSLSWESQID